MASVKATGVYEVYVTNNRSLALKDLKCHVDVHWSMHERTLDVIGLAPFPPNILLKNALISYTGSHGAGFLRGFICRVVLS